MGQFTKRLVTIEAMRFPGVGVEHTDEMARLDEWLAKHQGDRKCRLVGAVLVIPTLEGEMMASAGDWIIRGVKGELYPCKPDIFEATYTPAAISGQATPASGAKRLSMADIQSVIVSESYQRVPGSTFMVCFLTLRNGFIVTGESACADPNAFDQATGEKFARENAVEKIWTLEGYLLRERLAQREAEARGQDTAVQAA